MDKVFVVLLKIVIILRFELIIVIVLVRVVIMLKEELDYEEFYEFYYMDSKVVFGFISNEFLRF